MGDDIFDTILGETFLPLIKDKFDKSVKNLKKALEEKDFDLYKQTLMDLYVLAKTSKPFVGLEPFIEVFDICGLVLYLEGDEIKFIQKTQASEILFKKEK